MQFSTKLLSRMATVCLAAFGLFLSSLVAYGQRPLPDRSVPVVTVGGMQYDRPYPPAFPYQNVNDQMERQMDQMFREAALQRRYSPSPQPQPTVQRASLEPQQDATPDAPEKSELLKNAKDPDFILRNFKTMWVDARDAQYFGTTQLKAQLARNPGFAALNIRMVDDPKVADVILTVGYTFAWDYPFQVKHQNTTTVLLAGKGEGPFSGILGAADVAEEFVRIARPYRTPEDKTKP